MSQVGKHRPDREDKLHAPAELAQMSSGGTGKQRIYTARRYKSKHSSCRRSNHGQALGGLVAPVVVRPGQGCVDLVEGALTVMLAVGSGSRAEAFPGISVQLVGLIAKARISLSLPVKTPAVTLMPNFEMTAA